MESSFHLIHLFAFSKKVYFVKSILPSSDLTSINRLVMFWRCLSSTLPGGLSHCVFPCPLPRALIVLVKVCLVQPEKWHLNIWGKSLEYSAGGTTPSFCLSKIINIPSSPGNFRNKGVIWVWVTEEGTDGEQHLGEKCFKSGQVYAIGPGNHVIKGFMQTFDTVSAGDHWDRRMSRHMAPLLRKVKRK